MRRKTETRTLSNLEIIIPEQRNVVSESGRAVFRLRIDGNLSVEWTWIALIAQVVLDVAADADAVAMLPNLRNRQCTYLHAQLELRSDFVSLTAE